MKKANFEIERRENKQFNYKPAFGRATVDVQCPFCSEMTTCYVWSLSGSGKKCQCGAIHTAYGVSELKKKI